MGLFCGAISRIMICLAKATADHGLLTGFRHGGKASSWPLQEGAGVAARTPMPKSEGESKIATDLLEIKGQ
jgi:hypothetical protein